MVARGSRSWVGSRRLVPVAFLIVSAILVFASFSPIRGVRGQSALWPIAIDYPEDGSIFPPGITAPTFLWRDGPAAAWTIEVTFADETPSIHVQAKGERMRVGEIDPDAVSNTNELPQLTPRQAASWTWTPDAGTWKRIQAHSTAKPATVTITGYRDQTASFRRKRHAHDVDRSGGRTHLLPRCSAHAQRRRERHGAAPIARGHSSDSLASARYPPTREPHRAHWHAHLRQLPLVFRRRQDHGHRRGWSGKRQGSVRTGPSSTAHLDPEQGRHPVEQGWRARHDREWDSCRRSPPTDAT